ncbi:MAG: hypothetical protein OEW58_12930 [Gammaproteobacteria bacterium]|nr:hypothetical protein [Gammaproteobacteria bacterium]
MAKNKHLQHLVTDPDSPWYGDGQINGDDSGDGKNCDTINAGCTAGQTEIDQYTGEEVVVIGPADDQLFYYHPDHLGSTAYITDQNGDLKEHLEYFPFGETWVQEGGSKKTPYLYTSKEFDSETGLYYYGARYYDPRTSVWVSADPILEKYLPNVSDMREAQERGTSYSPEKKLIGMGGVYNALNMNLYHYSGLNPVKYSDPDGNATTVITVTDKKGMDHSAIHVDNPAGNNGKGEPKLYDPAGSFYTAKDPDDVASNDAANLQDYIDAYTSEGMDVTTQTFDTTPEQESDIAGKMHQSGKGSPGACTINVCSTIRGTGPFKDLEINITPEQLKAELSDLQPVTEVHPGSEGEN